MTTARAQIFKLLAFVQNAPENVGQDIMTFTGFMDDDAEVIQHLAYYAKRMNREAQIELAAKVRALQPEG